MDVSFTKQQLEAFTPEERLQAEKIVKELTRRKREERLRYFKEQTIDSGGNDQRGFLYSMAKIRAIFGGNRSGKTEIGMVDALLFLLGVHPTRSKNRKPPVYVRYCAPKFKDNVEAVLHKKIKELVPRKHLVGGSWATAYSVQQRTLRFVNGSELRFFSYDQDRDAYGGDDIDAFYMDEHGPHIIFIENMARCVDRNGYAVLTMTPEEGITWEEDEIIEMAGDDGRIDYWFFSTLSNPHLSKQGIRELEKTIKDPRLYDAKIHGKFVALSGMVYPTFDRGIHEIEAFDPPFNWNYQFIIDPHHRKASAMIVRCVNPDGESFVIRESEFEPHKGGVAMLAKHIRTFLNGIDHIDDWMIDEAMGGDGMNIFGLPSVKEGLNANGIPVVPTNINSDKAFAAGILKMRDKLAIDPITGRPTHFIFDTCPKTIKQFMKYRYRKETKVDEELLREHVRNVGDDLITCDRYGLMGEHVYLHTSQTQQQPQDDNW